MKDGRAEASLAMGDGGQAAISLTSDIDGTSSGSLLEPVAHSHFCATITTVHLQLSFSQTENLYLLHKTLHYPSLFPGIYNSNFYLYEIDYFGYHTLVESYVSVICTWFISLSMLSSRFVHVLVSELPSFFVVEQYFIVCIGFAKKFFGFFCIILWKKAK